MGGSSSVNTSINVMICAKDVMGMNVFSKCTKDLLWQLCTCCFTAFYSVDNLLYSVATMAFALIRKLNVINIFYLLVFL